MYLESNPLCQVLLDALRTYGIIILMQEELYVHLSEQPLMKLMAYQKVCEKGSISDIVNVADTCCRVLQETREQKKGRFRLDYLTLEGVKYRSQIMIDYLVDALEDIMDECEIKTLMTERPLGLGPETKMMVKIWDEDITV